MIKMKREKKKGLKFSESESAEEENKWRESF